MTTKEAIFIFSKDRPETLNKALSSIQHFPYTKYVIDDSITLLSQRTVSELCNFYLNCVYLGKIEFNQFTALLHIDFPKFAFLLRELGSTSWNLGYARNFALLYSKYIGLNKVLFMDDDIEVQSISIIDELFILLNQYKFVGANICQMTDHSIIEYIAIDLGINNENMLSGGFMFFNPQIIDHYFLNIYNEDWLWLYFQLKNERYLQTGNVFQSVSNPFLQYEQRIIFQEFGEVVIDGLLDLYNEDSYDSLTKTSFWERIIKERKEYLNILLKKAKEENKKEFIEIIEYVKSNSRNSKATIFKSLFEKYSSDRILFQHLYNSFL
jgi:hypothetical protein